MRQRLSQKIGHTTSQIAINWVRQQQGNIIPILGCRTESQLQDNLGCLDFRLDDDAMRELEQIAGFRAGFPNSFLHSNHVRNLIFGDTFDLIDRV